MHPMDFEEFLWANSIGELVIEHMKNCFYEHYSLEETLHHNSRFSKYVNEFDCLISSGIALDAKAISEPKLLLFNLLKRI